MIALAFPYVPLSGSSPTTYLILAGLMGIGFGFFLERSGFGSAKMLTAVFVSRDWQVYRVMFTALITAMLGSQLLGAMGVLDLGLLEVNTTYLAPMFFGGILFGVGFYFGGFCPGTAVVSAVRGRLDALFFLFGIVAGIYVFALFFDGPGQQAWFQNFYLPDSAAVMTINGNAPAWLVAVAVTLGVLLSFRYVYYAEQRFHLFTPKQIEDGEIRQAPEMPLLGVPEKAGLGLVAATAVTIGALQFDGGDVEEIAIGSEIPAAVAVDRVNVPTVDPLSLAGWVVSDAKRLAEEKPQNIHVIDLRPIEERTASPVRDSVVVPNSRNRDELMESTRTVLDDILTSADKNKPLVIVSSGDLTSAANLVSDLRSNGLNAMLLDGGGEAWQDRIIDTSAEWPTWVVATLAETDAEAPVPDVGDYHVRVSEWMVGKTSEVPGYISLPGTVQLPSEAATVAATGGGGGGCG